MCDPKIDQAKVRESIATLQSYGNKKEAQAVWDLLDAYLEQSLRLAIIEQDVVDLLPTRELLARLDGSANFAVGNAMTAEAPRERVADPDPASGGKWISDQIATAPAPPVPLVELECEVGTHYDHAPCGNQVVGYLRPVDDEELDTCVEHGKKYAREGRPFIHYIA